MARIRAAAKVADAGMGAAMKIVKPGLPESQVAAAAEDAMRHAGPRSSGAPMSPLARGRVSPMGCRPASWRAATW